MGIISKTAKVRLWGNNMAHLLALGYEGKRGDIIDINIEHLPINSHSEVEILCDMCNKNKMTAPYKRYNTVVKNTGSYVCKECSPMKIKQTFLRKYGVEHIAKLQNIKDKKAKTNIERYGVVTPFQSPEVREKMSKTLYANSSQKVSRQQQYINNVYQGILNFPIKYYNADIYLSNDNLTIEYDGGFHLGNVIIGRETMEEHMQKEIIRNNIIKREGYKQMRIISTKDKSPFDQVLLEMLDYARNYFSNYPKHSWIEFNIDTSTVRNAEHREGIPYSYGSLRTIRDKDIQQKQNNASDCKSVANNNTIKGREAK